MKSYHPRHIHHHFLRNLHIPSALLGLFLTALFLTGGTIVFAAKNVNFHMVINPGTLAVNIVDQYFSPVANPSVDMGSIYESNTCQSMNGTFGTTTQRIYVKNPDVADNGWVVTLSAASPTNTWSGSGHSFDFNDSTAAGCSDGGDVDTLGGQMAIDPSSGTLALGACSLSCVEGFVVRGSAAAFQEGVIDSITLLSASAGSSDSADWVLQSIPITQTLPANQSVSANYALDLFLSVTAN